MLGSDDADNERQTSENSDRSGQHQLLKYFIAVRPWYFTASLTSVALGNVLAYKQAGLISPSVFLTVLLTVLSVHAAGNLLNTYFDYLKGVDTTQSEDRTIVDSKLTLKDVWWLAMVLYTSGILGFLILCFISSAKVCMLAEVFLIGTLASYHYSGGLELKYFALGEFIVFLSFGPVAVMFSFLTQAGEMPVKILVFVSLPLALHFTAVIHAKNIRYMISGNSANIQTLAITLGWLRSYILFTILLFVPYILFVSVGTIHISDWMLLPVLTITKAFNIERDLRGNQQVQDIPQRTANLHTLTGVLYLLAVILSDGLNIF